MTGLPPLPETVPGTPAGRAAVGRPVLLLVGFAAALVAILGMRTMADLLGPAFLALVMVIAAHPVRGWFQRRGLPGALGTAVALLAIYAAVLGLTISLVVAGARFTTLVPTYQRQLDGLLDGLTNTLGDLGVGEEQINQMFAGFDLGKLASVAGDVLSSLLGVLSGLFFIVTLVLFMAIDAAHLPEKLARVPLPRRDLAQSLGEFASSTRTYLLVSTVFGLVVAVIDSLVLAWIGVPGALLWGLLAFVTNYIPNIGFVLGVVPPAIIGLLEGGPGMFLAVVAAYSVINVVIQTVIQPKIVGDAVGLSGTVTMLSLVFWASTLGAMGALLAVPLTLLFKAVLVDADPATRWIAPLMAGGPAQLAEATKTPAGRRSSRTDRGSAPERQPAAGS
jgi:AI-2 transport protein TqsA